MSSRTVEERPPITRRPGVIIAAAIASALVAGTVASSPIPATAAAVQPGAVAADQQISSFTLGVLPDTQFYSRYATTEEGKQFQSRYGTEPFSSQTRWLVDNDDELGIPFVTHLGDVVDQVGKPNQWIVASDAMKVLEDGDLEYSILPGNHDVAADWQTDAQRNPASEPYLSTFSTARAADKNAETFQGRDPLGYSEYHIFEKDGEQYLQLALSWRASDATLDWAQGVLDAHKDLPTILTSHQLLNIAANGVDPAETDFGLHVWNRLISPNNQIFMTLNGHHHGNANWLKTNAAGNPVLQIVNDYQMAYQGGNGYLGLYEFDFTNSQIRASQVSPWVVTKAAVLVNQFDQAVLRKPNERYNVPFDLAGRFTAIDPTFVAGPADHTSYTEKAVDILYANYTEPETPARDVAENEDDYYHASNTVAHWTFDGADGESVPVGATIADTEGANPLKRVKLINGATEGDVTWSSGHHALAANQGSVCFTGADRDTKRMSYFSTAANTPLTRERFPNGYTIETFIKIDETWTQEKNRWMSALAAGGTRVSGSSDGEAPPFFMGISNLLEVQWSVDPTNAAAKTNWSGEILRDTWLHVAAVNDVGTQTTTLYIEGAPVLRNSNGGVTGIETILGAAWKLGASSDYGTPDGGFLGCIGETRIVAQPLSADQWLTSRAQEPSTQTRAVSAADSFERHNGSLGADWADARGNWAIKGTDAVVADSVGANVVASTATTLGDSFTVTSTLALASQNGNAQWVGTAFNIAGDTPGTVSYYQLRYAPNWSNWAANRWQLVKVVDGTTMTVLREGLFAADPTRPIESTISRSFDELQFSMEDYLGQTMLDVTSTIADFPSRTGGFAGLASNGSDLVASAFAVKSSAAPIATSAPKLVEATVDKQSVSLSWAAPSDLGGSAVTGYTATVRELSGSTVGGVVATATTDADTLTATIDSLEAGRYVVSVRATNAAGDSDESGFSTALEIEEAAVEPEPEPEDPAKLDSIVEVDAASSSYGKPVSATVSVTAHETIVAGAVALYVDGKPWDSVELVDGEASVKLPRLTIGTHAVTAEFLGNSEVLAGEKSTMLSISKGLSKATVALSKTAITVKAATRAYATVVAPGSEIHPSGKVQFFVKGKVVATATLTAAMKGKVSVALPKFTKTGTFAVTVKYLGSSGFAGDGSTSAKVRVTR